MPIRYRDITVGNLYLTNKQGEAEFSESDERLVRVLAGRAAAAIETANLYAAEAARRAWLLSVIDQLPEGIILLDANGRVTAMNQAVVALSCGDTGTIDRYGNPMIFDIRSPEGRTVAFEDLPLVRAFQAGEVVTGNEYLLRQRDGRFVPILASAAPVRNEQGRINGATIIIQDISKAKEFDRMREEWAAIIAHDLRQPAAVIRIMTELLPSLRAGTLEPKERDALDRISAASERLNRMIDDLLDISQIEARRLSVKQRPADLGALINNVVANHRDTTSGLAVFASESTGQAYVDPDRIQQVLENLLSNAVKYGEPRTPILVEMTGRANEFEITVTNRGPGIAPDQLPVLFGRFSRTREAKTENTPGLGLGLYISKGLVEAHGGKMWVESSPGQFTCFHFTVPRAPHEHTQVERPSHERDPARGGRCARSA